MEIAAQKAGLSRTYFQDTLGFEKIGEFPFDSDRKMMSVIYQQNTAKIGQGSFGSGFSLVLAKGAPEGILKSCTGYLEAPSTVSTKRLDDIQNFTSQPMTDDLVERISKQSSEMASRGLRVLAYAVRKVSSEEASGICQSKKDDKSECELSFVGLIGLIDPPK